MIGVLVVDDQPLVRAGIRAVLERADDLRVTGEAGDGRAALDRLRATPADVVLMDLRMPVLDGVEATRRIAADPVLGATAVLALTTFDDDDLVFGALRAGASGFLLKDAEPDALRRAVRAAAAGEAVLDPGVTRSVVTAALHAPPAQDPTALRHLTDREREVLAAVGRGLSNEEIGRELHMSPATARTHVGRVLTKLAARDRARLVAMAWEHGLVSPAPRMGPPGSERASVSRSHTPTGDPVTGKSLTKLIGFLAFLAVVAGATVAAWDYESTSSSSRGRGLETVWHGLLALVGQEENATGDMIWIGRGLALVGVALLVLYVVRRVRAHRPATADRPSDPQHTGQHHAPGRPAQQYAPAQHAPQQYAPEQYAPEQYAAPQQEQQQVQWSTGGPQPAPPPTASLSWGAVTSGPTPLPPVPQERPRQERPEPERPEQERPEPEQRTQEQPAPQTRQPDPADMTREVIIPPLPPGWGRG